jgi:pSer/pThr/pTyr-binding forkhead associated (FHA) protein
MTFREKQTSTLEPEARRMAMVVGLRSTTDSKTFTLPPAERRWVIGSGASCDLVIDDPFVSDVHCVLERRPGGVLVVRDRRSRNGTRVDGNYVEGAEVRVGSYVTLGRTTLVAVSGPGAREEQRWWTIDEIERSEDEFAPRALAAHLRELIAHGSPNAPVDVGR